MSTYSYIGYTKDGKKIKGVRDTESILALRKEFANKGIFVEEITELGKKDRNKKALWKGFGLKKKTGTLFFQIALLLKGGIQLVEALKIVADNTKSVKLKGILFNMSSKVAEGRKFSAVIEDYEWLFGKVYVSLIRASEGVGRLPDVLMDISVHEEKKSASKNKIASALIYPFTVLIIGLGVVGFLLGYVVPKMEKVFESVHRQLPLITRILIAVGNFLQNYGIYLFGFILVLFLVFEFLYTKNKQVKYIVDKWLYTFAFFRNAYLARFSETLAFQLKERLVLTDAIENTADVVGNEYLKAFLKKIASDVNGGEGFSFSAKKYKIFPEILVAAIKTGEKSGNLSEMLVKTGQFFNKYVDLFSTRFIALIEPLFIVFIGFIVGFIVMSIMIPLFDINTFVK